MIRQFSRLLLDNKTKSSYLFIFILIVITAILSVCPIVLIRDIVDLAITKRVDLIEEIIKKGFLYLLIQIIRAITEASLRYLAKKNQSRVALELQMKVFNHLKYASMNEIRFGDLTGFSQTVLQDTQYVGQHSVEPFIGLIKSLLTFSFGLYYMSKISFKLTLIVLPLSLFSSIAIKIVSKKSIQNITVQREETSQLWKTFNEGILGFIPLRIHNYIEDYIVRIQDRGEQLQNTHINQARLESLVFLITTALFMVTIGLIIIIASIFVIYQKATIGGLTAILMYNHMLSDPLIQLQDINQQLIKLRVSFQRIMNIFDLPIDDKALKLAHTGVDGVKIEKLYLKINDNTILKNVNLNILPKSSIMIKGESGSGKTSLINILTGVYELTDGSMKFYYKSSITDSSPKVSYMMQDEYIFDDTIENNIRIGNKEITLDEIKVLIDICELDKVYENFGNDPIGENGVKLSGGERKRLLIARTLADASADIFVFDEMSASLDENNYKLIWDRLEELLSNKIRIYIEHNPYIENRVDSIITIENSTVKGDL